MGNSGRSIGNKFNPVLWQSNQRLVCFFGGVCSFCQIEGKAAFLSMEADTVDVPTTSERSSGNRFDDVSSSAKVHSNILGRST